MSTLTPNYNLIKPDSTDPFGDFRQDYNDNMDIIDANLGGGGGSGGHTIIDENDTPMTQRTGLQFTGNVSVSDDAVNDKTVVDILGGGGNVYGAFIDPDRVVYSGFTFDSNTQTWTATEDVILTGNMLPPDGSTAYFVQIDGVQVFAGYSTLENPFVYVKQGQVVTYRGKSGSTMKAYGIKQGTNGIFAPVIYSDTERVIGVWRDNKPLYQKTLVLNNLNLDASGTAVDISSLGVEMCTPIYAGSYYIVSGVIRGFARLEYQEPNDLYLFPAVNSSNTTCFVTIQYTKTADVAGSGNWNTDGVPTVHYSTSEQVIGTWENGKPLYEKVVKNLSIALNGSDWVYYNTPNDIDEVIRLECYSDNGGKLLHCAISEYRVSTSNGVQFSGFSGMNRTVNEMVIRYTKTTD